MYTGQIKHFFKGVQNGLLEYTDDGGHVCNIPFYRQNFATCMSTVSIRVARGRGWKYGDIVEFEIVDYEGQEEANFTRFLGNPLLDELKETLGEDNRITGYFYRHDNLSYCTIREKSTGVEFRVKNIKGENGWVFPDNGTEVEAIIKNWDVLSCLIDEDIRNKDFDDLIDWLKNKRFVRAEVIALLGERVQVNIANVPYPCYVIVKEGDDYNIGDPLNVRYRKSNPLTFTVI